MANIRTGTDYLEYIKKQQAKQMKKRNKKQQDKYQQQNMSR